tara:strand:- start:1410 stop:2513 length:1104 start_codon:yes stop_codon:yes gene_type:complete
MSEKEIKEHQLFISSYPVIYRLWRDNKERITKKKMFFKILLFTTISAPFRWVQKILYQRRINKINLNQKPPVFVIGHWRSGTTHLHYLLAQDQRFSFLEAFQAFFFRAALVSRIFMKPILNKLMPKTRPQDNVEINASAPTEEEHSLTNLTHMSGMQSFFFPQNLSYFSEYNLFETSPENITKWKYIYDKMLKQIAFYNGKNRQLLLKNPHNTGRIKILKELYPNAKFIFIHRNPYEVFNSTQHLYRTTIKSQFLQDFGEQEINERVLLGYEKTMMAYLEQRHEIDKENLIEISYNELSEQPMNCIENIYRTLKIGDFTEVKTNFQKYLDNQKNYKKNTFNPVPSELKNQINNRWAFAFEAWDYEMN